MGCSLLHLTLEAAQESHEARSLGFRSGTALEGWGAEIGEMVGGVVEGPIANGECHC